MRNRLVVLAMAGIFAACGEVPTEPSASSFDLDPSFSTSSTFPETVDLDTRQHGLGGSVAFASTTSNLESGVVYRVTVDGNWSAWPEWTCDSPSNTKHHSPGLATSTQSEAGMDAEWLYARHNNCTLSPGAYAGIWFSQDGGASVFDPTPIDATYDGDHVYEYLVTGTGSPLSFRHGDVNTGDNYGVMKVTVAVEVVDTDGDGVPDDLDLEPNLNNNYYYVDWTAADPAGGTASGTITLPDSRTIGVDLRVVNPNGTNGYFYAPPTQTSCGTRWWEPSAPHVSGYVLNPPPPCDFIGLTGGTLSSYVITFSAPVQDPVMAIQSLGRDGSPTVYDFDRTFEVISEGAGYHDRYDVGSYRILAGEKLEGQEWHGTIRFIGQLSTLSWTAPTGEVWHGFTLAIRGAGDANADYDGDGVLDSDDNCPTTPNADQADSDFDGVGTACDAIDDSGSDTDGDGLTNSEEHAIGTSPTNPDTDGDGVNDGDDDCPLDPNCQTLDSSAPAIAATVTGDLGDNGWYTSDVSVSWTVTDAESDYTTTGCESASVTSDTDGVTFTCEATSAGGTDSESVTITRDATDPTVSVALGGTLHNGWYNTDVTVDWTTADNLSGIASDTCADNTITTDGTHSQECAVTDQAGNSATGTTGDFKRDATDPTVTYSGNAGSYDVAGFVGITCAAADNLSGIDSDTCADISGAAYTFGLGTTAFSASADDVAGNTGSASGSFEVTASLDGLCTLVQRFVSHNGVANSLCAKTRAAERARNDNAHDGALGAFINEVEAQSGKKIDADDAAVLITIATALIG